MTTNFLIALTELLRECPACHKISLDQNSKLEISSDKIIRTCKCGYKIEMLIKEGTNVVKEEPQLKILNENVNKEEKENGSNNS